MKLCRFNYKGDTLCGILEEDIITVIAEKDLLGDITPKERTISANEVKFLCPTEPRNIFAVGLNYKSHAEEMNMALPKEPLVFLKATSALTPHNTCIIRPVQTNELSCEAELAIVVKKKCKDVSVQNVSEYILGYSMINDVTARDIQRRESQWARAKSFDTFCPYGPVVETDIEKIDGEIKLIIDGDITQCSTLKDMIFSPKSILSYLSGQVTLYPGDIVATGTPSGVGTVYPGQRAEVRIDNIGSLCNRVISGDDEND